MRLISRKRRFASFSGHMDNNWNSGGRRQQNIWFEVNVDFIRMLAIALNIKS